MAKQLKALIKKSSLMDIKLRYNGETFKFNLNEELSINPDKINQELKEQPSYYSFLLLLQSKLLVLKEDKEREMEKAYAKSYSKYAVSINEKTNRIYSDKLAKELAISNDTYQKAHIEYLTAKNDYGIIQSAVKGFEQRFSLIQTLSANLRRESN
jgi:hypothetical protein